MKFNIEGSKGNPLKINIYISKNIGKVQNFQWKKKKELEAIKGNFICETVEGTETQRKKHQKLELKSS